MRGILQGSKKLLTRRNSLHQWLSKFPEILLEVHKVKTTFIIIQRWNYVCSSHTFPCKHTVDCSEATRCASQRWNAEADMRIHLSSPELNIQEISRTMQNNATFLICFQNIFFVKEMLFILTGNGFIFLLK